MEEKRRQRKDFWQNITITLLAVSAVALFLQTQLYQLGADKYGHLFAFSAVQADPADIRQTEGLTAPVRVAVSGPYGRYASVTMHTDEDAFSGMGRVLGEALDSAREMEECTEERFRTALIGTAVFYDFLNPLPLSILSDLTGMPATAQEKDARGLAVAMDEGGVALFLWDGAEGYSRCDTSVTPESLESQVNRFEMSSVRFAFEYAEAETIMPYTLFLQDAPTLPVLKESILNAEVEDLLEALQFNPRTNYRYRESENTEVVVEGSRTLRIHTDGSISYRGGEEEVLRIEAADTSPAALAVGCDRLLDSLMAVAGGSQATMYLESCHQDGDTVTLVYEYELGGIPICMYNGESAAVVTLSGATVEELELRFRQYSATETTSVLLPVRQAAAIARQHGKDELFLGYVGGSVGTLSAEWLAE